MSSILQLFVPRTQRTSPIATSVSHTARALFPSTNLVTSRYPKSETWRYALQDWVVGFVTSVSS
eukprot:4229975-Amphidinium_carterae.1